MLKILSNFVAWPFERFYPGPASRVDGFVKEVIVLAVMVVNAPYNVTAVTTDIDVLGLRRIDQRIDG